MEGLVQDLPCICVYFDDILVTGASKKDHLNNLEAVLARLKSAGFRMKKHKCSFLLPSVEYLGHEITAEELKPSKRKAQAIRDAPTPTDISQLRSFLGLINY